MTSRRIEPGEKVPVTFTAREGALVIDHTFAGPELTEPLESARLTRGKGTVRYSLDALDELVGYVAAAANHSKSKSLVQHCRCRARSVRFAFFLIWASGVLSRSSVTWRIAVVDAEC